MRRYLLPLAGLLVAALGAVLAVTRDVGSQDFGWFAYTPLEDSGPDWFMGWGEGGGNASIVTQGQVIGIVVLVLGLLIITGWIGYRIGSRGRDT